MLIHQLKSGALLLVMQEDHTDLSGQFAAHWGNERFARLRPYLSMVYGTTWHDSGYREWEHLPPINVDKGRPNDLGEPLSFPGQLDAYVRNIEWVRSYDRYAGLVVSMHRTGLWQQRYETIRSPKGGYAGRALRPDILATMERLEASQKVEKQALSNGDLAFGRELWVNYRLLQFYDLFSLYFCWDGYINDDLRPQLIGPVPVGYESDEDVDIHITPVRSRTVRLEPYPFDVAPLVVMTPARTMTPMPGVPEEEIREAFHKAPRCLLEFTIMP